MQAAQAYQIHAADNVVTLLSDVSAGTRVKVLGETGDPGGTSTPSLTARAGVREGHKLAVRSIAAGEDVLKFGVPIGYATVAIEAGDWVHLHNCASHFDDRSQTLDLETGAATDTVYE